jgi:hypothetical protein
MSFNLSIWNVARSATIDLLITCETSGGNQTERETAMYMPCT